MTGKKSAVFFALLAAALYAVNIPLSKLLEESGAVTPAMLAGLLYCGAGVGMAAVFCFKRISGINREEKLLCRKDLPYTVAMVLLDIAAPVLLMFGIANTSAFLLGSPVFRRGIQLCACRRKAGAAVLSGFGGNGGKHCDNGAGHVKRRSGKPRLLPYAYPQTRRNDPLA